MLSTFSRASTSVCHPLFPYCHNTAALLRPLPIMGVGWEEQALLCLDPPTLPIIAVKQP